jgi:hypothetical protein
MNKDDCEWCEGNKDCPSFGPAKGFCPGYACTREKGHAGKHVACSLGHATEEWDDNQAAWIANVPVSDKPLTLEDLKRVKNLCDMGSAKPDIMPCKSCGNMTASFMVPGDGFYCNACLPPDVEIQDFP